MLKVLPLFVVAGLLLSSCHGKVADDQLVAKGKDFEVTAPELDQLLRAAPQVSKEQVTPVRRSILNALIDQKLFATVATDQKLDRDLETMQRLEASRRQILAEAYLDRLTRSASAPTDSDIAAYYDTHPSLFANRRVLTIQQIGIKGDPKALAEYKQALDDGGIAGLASRLGEDGIDAKPTNFVLASESLPASRTGAIDKLMVGSTIAFGIGGVLHLGVVSAVQDAGVPLADAREQITTRLLQERRQGIVRSEADRLRAERNVEITEPSLKPQPGAR